MVYSEGGSEGATWMHLGHSTPVGMGAKKADETDGGREAHQGEA